jgi:hypothetical protein
VRPVKKFKASHIDYDVGAADLGLEC